MPVSINMPTYRFDDAIADGVPISEINREAASRIGYRYDAAIKDGVPEEDILKELRSRYAKQEEPTSNILVDNLERAVGGVPGTVGSVVDLATGIPKFIGKAALQTGGILTGEDPEIAREAASQTMEGMLPEVSPFINKQLGGKYLEGAKGAHTAFMAPFESIANIVEGTGGTAEKALLSFGVSPKASKEFGQSVSAALELGMAAAPAGKPIAKKLSGGSLFENPVTESVGFPFNKTEIPKNFDPNFAKTRIVNELIDKQLEKEQKAREVPLPNTAVQGELELGQQNKFGQRPSEYTLDENGIPIKREASLELQQTERGGADLFSRENIQREDISRNVNAWEQPDIFGDTVGRKSAEVDAAWEQRAKSLAEEQRLQRERERATTDPREETAAVEPSQRSQEVLSMDRDKEVAQLREIFGGDTVNMNMGIPISRETLLAFKDALEKTGGKVFFRTESKDHTLISQFDPIRSGKSTGNQGIYGKGQYVTTNPDIISGKDSSYGQYLREDSFSPKNPFVIDSTSAKELYTLWKSEGLPVPKDISGLDLQNPSVLVSKLAKQNPEQFSNFMLGKGYDSLFELASDGSHIKEGVVFSGTKSGLGRLQAPVNKQKGMVNFGFSEKIVGKEKPTEVTPEELISAYKTRTGKDLSVSDAITLAKEHNTLVVDVQTKTKQQRSSLEKRFGTAFTNRETLTPDEVKVGLDNNLIKDIDNNQFKKLINTTARGIGSTYSLRAYYDNPILEAVLRPLSRAADSAKYTADHLLYGKDGVATKIRRLTQNEFESMYDKLVKYEGKDVPESVVTEGFSRAQIEAYRSLRKAQEQDLARKNEARAIEGKKPLTPRSNYLASTWLGDRMFQVLNKEGELVGVVTGYSKDLEVARSWIRENHPDYQMTQEASTIKTDRFTVKDNLAELYDLLLKDQADGKVNIQEAVLTAMADARILASEKVRGTHLHEKFKKETPVFGAEGLKPWKDSAENARDLFQAQVAHLEGSILRSELAKAAKTIEDFKTKVGNLNAIKLAENKLQDMQGLNDSTGIKGVEKRLAKGLSDSGTLGEGVLKGYRNLTPMINAAMNIKYFGVNVMHGLINLAETLVKTPVGIVHGMEQVPVLMRVAAPWGLVKTGQHLAELTRSYADSSYKLSGDTKYFHDYAMKQNVGNPTVEVVGSVAPETILKKLGHATIETINTTISGPEIASRYTAFTTMAHTFKTMGLDQVHAADLAHDMVKLYFKDYSKLEAAAIFTRLGELGMSGRQLRTWVLGEVMNYSSALANGNFGLLTSMIGLTALVYGADSVPLFKQVDELSNWVRQFAVSKSKDVESSLKLAESMTPREWLYTKTGGDPRGLLDKSLESVGVSGSSLGSSEWRLLPTDVTEVLPKIKYLVDSGVSLANAVKEVFKPDTNLAVVAREATSPVAPKVVTRAIERHGLQTKDGLLLNPQNNLTPSKGLSNKAEERAYSLGMQPKTSALSRFGEDLEKRRVEGVKERRDTAKNKLVEAYNNLQIDPKATNRYEQAVKNFVVAHQGSDLTDASLRRILEQTGKELKFSKAQLDKLSSIVNTKNNMELVKFFRDVTGTNIKKRVNE